MKNSIKLYLTLILCLVCFKGFCGKLIYPTFCPEKLNILTNEKINCGYFTVPEKHESKNSKQIKLFFINAKSTGNKIRPDPVFYLIGGPGIAPSEVLRPFLKEIQLLRKSRDVIFIDERGSGYSLPSLVCNVHNHYFNTQQELKASLEQCKQRYQREHIDISAYNTFEDAQDIINLSKLLNLRKWNIIGNSYGTRLALAISQFNPKGLRSIVLDSTLSLKYFNINDIAFSITSGYKKFFAECENDVVCRKNYPNLQDHFIEMVESLPKTVTEANKLYLTGEAVIHQNSAGAMGSSQEKKMTAELIETIYKEYLKNSLTLEKFKHIYSIKDKVYDLGLMKIMTCYDEQGDNILQWQLKQIELANKNYPYYFVSSKDYGVNSIDCQVFGHGDALSPLRENLKTSIPIMILHGQNDTIPLYISEELEKSLTHAKIYIFKKAGHHVLGSSTDAKYLIEQFFNDPLIWPVVIN